MGFNLEMKIIPSKVGYFNYWYLRHWTMATKARMMAARLPAPS